MAIRLNKFLAAAGLGSRRKVEELIKNGQVKVNDQTIINLATAIDPNQDTVKVGNRVIKPQKKVYILLNKPAGYLTTVSDEFGRKNVLELIPIKERIFPVGRLDKNSRGLLILTNDGDFADKLLHPRHKIEKVYKVKVSKELTSQQLENFRQGIVINGRKTAPAAIRKISEPRIPNSELYYEVVLKEGRKRQIRRMLEALGHKVLDLKRTKIGSLQLNYLKEGHWRPLTLKEITDLLNKTS